MVAGAENNNVDIIEMLETNETAHKNEEIINKMTSGRRKSILYGYLIKHNLPQVARLKKTIKLLPDWSKKGKRTF